MSSSLPQRRLRGLAAAAVAVTAALVLSACGSASSGAGSSADPDAPDLGELTVQLSWVKNVEFAGEYFADSEGYFTDEGFSSVTLVAGPAPTATLVATGQAMVGISDPTRVAPAIANEDAPVKIIANQYQRSPFSIISLTDEADIATPADLVGKRIGIQTGNEPLFYALLDANDISQDDVEIVPVEYDPTPLITGDVDGFLGYVTNEAVMVEARGYGVTNLLYADNGLPLVAKSIVVSQDSIDNNREALKGFLRASILGWQDAIADPAGSAALAVETYGADLDLELEERQAVAANDLLVSEETEENGLFTISDERSASVIDLLNEIGITITADELFDFSLLSEVYEENPELIG